MSGIAVGWSNRWLRGARGRPHGAWRMVHGANYSPAPVARAAATLAPWTMRSRGELKARTRCYDVSGVGTLHGTDYALAMF